MIYAPENCDLILKGIKTQTRRPRNEVDTLMTNDAGHILAVYRKGRLLWGVGKTYAIKPGRTKKSVGRILLTEIRSEPVGKITLTDAIAEGVGKLAGSPDVRGMYDYYLNGKVFMDADPRVAYLNGWKDFYKKSDFTEDVWVLTFKRAP